MTWDQVRWLCLEGFEIGLHTRTHVDLGEVFHTRVSEEIVESRRELEEKLSIPIDLFAYPYGGKNHMKEESRDIVKAVGLRCCCSCFGGLNSAGTDPFRLRRIPISSSSGSPRHFGFEVALRST